MISRELSGLVGDHKHYAEIEIDKKKVAVNHDLTIKRCDFCKWNGGSFAFNKYCPHIESLYILKFGKKAYNKIYIPFLDSLKLKNILKRSKKK